MDCHYLTDTEHSMIKGNSQFDACEYLSVHGYIPKYYNEHFEELMIIEILYLG